ncbi:hypothetical protein [Saccharopolyspora sp. CA-218241]|uniref:hypothetical protein n=1 Tax=Saccharopolyspora sp. CA-218241 TaxID=3240027 RepID=UPI003D969582
MRSTSSMVKLLVKHWAEPDEQVVYVFGAEERAGYVVSTVGGSTRVPHEAEPSIPRAADQRRAGPEPIAALRDGAFLGDEFVHDPGAWAWALAGAPGETAIRFADDLTAWGSASFLAFTSHRVGVVVATDDLESAPPAESASEGGFSLLGAARSAVRGVFAGDGENPVTSGADFALGQARELVAVPRGRGGYPVWFLRVTFADGSSLEVRAPRAQQRVDTIRQNLR